MATTHVYDPQYAITGWFDSGGYRKTGGADLSWFNRELTYDTPLSLVIFEPLLFLDDDIFYVLPPITVEIMPSIFLDDDLFFTPMAVRILSQPDQMLKNEVRRIR